MGQESSIAFDIESEWMLDAREDEILDILDDPMSLTRWWSPVFMRGELISAGDRNKVGLTARFYTKGLLPHTFQFTARIDRLDERREMRIFTWGDFDGRGDIRLCGAGERTLVRIRWRTSVYQPYIRSLIRLFKPVFTANHRWAMRRGREGLQAEIRRRRRAGKMAQQAAKPTFPHNLGLVQKRFNWTRESMSWQGK